MATLTRVEFVPSAPPYPYQSPPPPPPPPDRPNNPQTIRSTRRTSLGKHICNVVTLVFLVATVVSFIVWLLYWDRMRSVYLPQFKVESATVSQLNSEGSLLTSTWDITLLATNPNRKHKIFFDNALAGVAYLYGDTSILLGQTQPLQRHFSLDERNNGRVDIKLELVRKSFADGVVKQISNDRSRRLVRFDVALIAYEKFKARLVPSIHYRLKLLCPVDFGFPGNNVTGVLTGLSRCTTVR
ncbi:uncharacterized protein LOC126797120 [Argentina anserina]|uniref:uncharacterized protein LOC126797120 n=1 Tax=Argentina anserina TaxID=57926 RepID=UPI0021765B05|nr:uncharacterized protein LOC126797120 [Potentilla anserina]